MKTKWITLLLLAAPSAAYATPGIPADPAALTEMLQRGQVKNAEATTGAVAAPASTIEAESPMGAISSMFGIAFGVAGLMVGGALLLKRLKSKGMFDAANHELRLEESLWVGRGQRLLLVSVGERRVLLGVTGAGFEGLAVLDQEVGPAGALSMDSSAALSVAPPPTPAPRRDPEISSRTFAQVLDDGHAFKPSPSDRRRIIQRLNTL